MTNNLQGIYQNGGGGGDTFATPYYIIPSFRDASFSDGDHFWYTGGYTGSGGIANQPTWAHVDKHWTAEGNDIYSFIQPPKEPVRALNAGTTQRCRTPYKQRDHDGLVDVSIEVANMIYIGVTNSIVAAAYRDNACHCMPAAVTKVFVGPEPIPDDVLSAPPYFPVAGGTTGLGGRPGLRKRNGHYEQQTSGQAVGGTVTANQVYPCYYNDFETPTGITAEEFNERFNLRLAPYAYSNYTGFKLITDDEAILAQDYFVGITRKYNVFSLTDLRKDSIIPIGGMYASDNVLMLSGLGNRVFGGAHYCRMVVAPQWFLYSPMQTTPGTYASPWQEWVYKDGITYNAVNGVTYWLP